MKEGHREGNEERVRKLHAEKKHLREKREEKAQRLMFGGGLMGTGCFSSGGGPASTSSAKGDTVGNLIEPAISRFQLQPDQKENATRRLTPSGSDVPP